MRACTIGATLLVASSAMGAQLTVEEPYPLRGVATHVLVTEEDGSPVEGAVVVLTYRPNSMVTRVDSLPPTDESGRTVWVPLDAGICTVRAYAGGGEIAAKDVSVRFDRFPLQGALVMVVAFCALFGGATLSLAMLLRSPGEFEEVATPVRGT